LLDDLDSEQVLAVVKMALPDVSSRSRSYETSYPQAWFAAPATLRKGEGVVREGTEMYPHLEGYR
jgi:hypothetical protein